MLLFATRYVAGNEEQHHPLRKSSLRFSEHLALFRMREKRS